jgi:hypothetical protein
MLDKKDAPRGNRVINRYGVRFVLCQMLNLTPK